MKLLYGVLLLLRREEKMKQWLSVEKRPLYSPSFYKNFFTVVVQLIYVLYIVENYVSPVLESETLLSR